MSVARRSGRAAAGAAGAAPGGTGGAPTVSAATPAGGTAADACGDATAAAPVDGTVAALDELRHATLLLLGSERRLRGRTAKRGDGLSHSHLRALKLLVHAGEATAGDLARATDLNPASVTAMIDQLEQRGLLQRQRSPQDRRVCLVALTGRGRDLVDLQERAWFERLHAAFADVTEADMQAACVVLRRLTSVMDRMCEE